ncbi:hypothetical protein RR42_s0043 [Cupriavidus basilensis]|uniref:Uncharacterized protein n=1 Tax=Cupriavidus basilensis TaxID=68895 RepID=A0A0C4YM47_9BURK|nr:hypothetical protein RR42_s0043 [Cupriavidus basilensis]
MHLRPVFAHGFRSIVEDVAHRPHAGRHLFAIEPKHRAKGAAAARAIGVRQAYSFPQVSFMDRHRDLCEGERG